MSLKVAILYKLGFRLGGFIDFHCDRLSVLLFMEKKLEVRNLECFSFSFSFGGSFDLEKWILRRGKFRNISACFRKLVNHL